QSPALLLFAQLVGACPLLRLLVRLAPDVPAGDTGFLGVLGARFSELLSALLGRGWDREPESSSQKRSPSTPRKPVSRSGTSGARRTTSSRRWRATRRSPRTRSAVVTTRSRRPPTSTSRRWTSS